jgi:hypothetical protein
MRKEIAIQIAELQQIHTGLTAVKDSGSEIIVSGPLPFEASTDGFRAITECFEIDLIIAINYPECLPSVRETGGKIDADYHHLNSDRTLCLAIPIEARRVFLEQPTLLGFINKLVVPYFYGYCHWKINGNHPFDESEHGVEGIVYYYLERLDLHNEITVLAVISFLVEYGYRGHHACPCGSGLVVRKCHGTILRDLHRIHSKQSLMHEFLSIAALCLDKNKNGQVTFPTPLLDQVYRILNSDLFR